MLSRADVLLRLAHARGIFSRVQPGHSERDAGIQLADALRRFVVAHAANANRRIRNPGAMRQL